MHTAPTDPFSLIDPYWGSHLKFAGRAPRTLEELAIARNDYEHRGRACEIKAMRPKLEQLNEFARPLWDKGIKLGEYKITKWGGGKELRLTGSLFSPETKLQAALIELGFREIERKDYGGRTDLVTLKHGRSLLVMIEVAKPKPAETATPTVPVVIAGGVPFETVTVREPVPGELSAAAPTAESGVAA